jgi:predicted DsbA family dithiol-disulfide isomerase
MSDNPMTVPIKIDFVSDVSCPWCVIGLKALQQALDNLGDTVHVDLHFQPFELNPQMPVEGQDITEHLIQKYGSTLAQLAQSRETLRARGAALGFEFSQANRSRVYNTFDAHRLLHWAGEQGGGRQLALKEALFQAYFTDGKNPGAHDVLIETAAEVGLDATRAEQILAGDEYADIVRKWEHFYTEQGIHSVPAVIINGKHLISGGQPVATFERALRQIAGVPELARPTG